MGGPLGGEGPHRSWTLGSKQSQLPISDPQSKTAKRSRGIIKAQRRLDREAAVCADSIQTFLPDQEGALEAEGLERTYKYRQSDILDNVNEAARKKAFNFTLSYGPYSLDFNRGGQFLLFGGEKGSAGILDCHDMRVVCELNCKETIRDVRFLHNHTLWAAAQKKYVYVYDNQGIEIHCLRDLMHRISCGTVDLQLTYCLEFLPYHFLMVSVGEFGELVYYDVSTGQVAAKHRTRRGPCRTMTHNLQNAVVHLGHSKGTVSLWTPNLAKPAVDMLCHKGRVAALAARDQYMVTAGVDGKWKLWDLRKLAAVQSFNYFGAPPSSISISQTGLVGIAFGPHVQIWKDAFSSTKTQLYMTHEEKGTQLSALRFRPFEDVCVFGSTAGLGSLLVPGAGLANFDTLDATPFETTKQRREREVHALLEKLPADMISFDTCKIGAYDQRRRAAPAETPNSGDTESKPKKIRNKQRGRNTAEKRKQKEGREALIKRRQLTAARLSQLARKTPSATTESDSETDAALKRDGAESRHPAGRHHIHPPLEPSYSY